LALAIAGLTSQNGQTVSASYIAMNVIAWYVILPLALFALLSGIVQAVGTPWGLAKHYWVLTKLVLTAFATLVLLLKMKPISYMAGVASGATLAPSDFLQNRLELLVHAAGGLIVLLTTTILSVFKPWGKTPFGRSDTHSNKTER
jgi:hypothetical protein